LARNDSTASIIAPESAVTAEATVETAANYRVFSAGKHLSELDGLRGLAILIVTIYRFARELPTSTIVGEYLHAAISLGQRGVDLFFVLSGFLITGVLLDSSGQQHRFRNFVVRRTLRIFPLYFFSLALFLFVIPALWRSNIYAEAQAEQFFLWTYLANLRMCFLNQWCFGALDHFWSLSVEEHFYLLWPLAVLGLGLKRTFVVAVVLAGFCAAARIGYASLPNSGVAPDVASVFRFDGLLLGAAVAALARLPQGLEKLGLYARWSLVPLVVGVLGTGLLFPRMWTIPHSVWAMFWGCFLVILLTSSSQGWLAALFRLSILRQLGKYSYGMYVFQSPLIPLVAGFWSTAGLCQFLGFDPQTSIAATLIYGTGMSLMTYAVAMLSWHCLEKHCLQLKRFFPASMGNKIVRESARPAEYRERSAGVPG